MIDLLTLLPFNLPGNIYRSPMPFSQMFDPNGEVFPLYLQACIQDVVVLPPQEELLHWTGFNLTQYYLENGINPINLPVEDFTAPPFGAFDQAVPLVIDLSSSGRNIAIHCHAGVGRTGMFAACLARERWGWDGTRAVEWVRQYIPRAIDTDYQMRFVETYKQNSIEMQ